MAAAFSKFAKNNESEKKSKNKHRSSPLPKIDFPFADYFKNKINLCIISLADLKKIAKPFKLKITTTKPILIERIKTYLEQWKQIIKIQAVFRRHLTKLSFILHGPALLRRDICINASDFYTLEPLNEISHNRFYSYSDESGFIYGFDIFSMITLFQNSNSVLNPYNRKPISDTLNHAKKIYRILCISKIIYCDKYVVDNENLLAVNANLIQLSNYITSSINTMDNTSSPNLTYSIIQGQSNPSAQTTLEQTVSLRIHRQRSQPIRTRINELFM